MHPILFQWGFLRVYSYGFFVALGILAATLLLVKKLEKQGKSAQFVIDLVILMVVAGIIGARLVYVFLYEPGYYLAHPLQILMLSQGGLAFYGALLFGLLAGYLYLRKIGVPFLAFLDLAAPAVALGYSFARIGCFLNGCCYGVPTNLPWGVVFPAVDDLPRHPTQLYSLLSGIVIFVILELVSRRIRFRGQIFSLFFILYGLSRSVIELFRENPFIWGGWVASVTALSVALLGGLLYIYLSRQGASAYLDSLERSN
ncbi:MAG TPA: prolipoprotein diacylglyceryl transferase [Syntrophomonadaceae bacterium]|nr:prolipoprotein diacylglyceryl transferase [Syntrophomonadaceae bacterium]